MKKIHFIGIGGIGMSGLARITLGKGRTITGSDIEDNDLTRKLRSGGACIHKGHSEKNVPSDVELVVRSSCIKDDNSEVKKARELDIPVIWRGEYLKMVMMEYPVSIAVTGTHGKTTTAALIAHILDSSGVDPTVIVGGEMERFDGNAKVGKSDVIVAEVDESDGTFQHISPTYGIVTNVEREHMDHFKTMEDIFEAYREFVRNIPPEGIFIYWGEDYAVCQLANASKCSRVDFGIDGDFGSTCGNLQYEKKIEFDYIISGMTCCRMKSSLAGKHNVRNILAALAVCIGMKIDFNIIAEALSSFTGVKRRFDLAGQIGNVKVIEDYAHHPTELKAIIRTAKDYGGGRVLTVFQPHRYSRTLDLAQDFVGSFYDSDALVVTDIYSAFEDETQKADIRDIFKEIDKSRFEAFDFVEKSSIPEYISGIVKDNDTVLVLGAGDIREVTEPIVKSIKKKFKVK
ncbi:MAG: UDP-N-acetylmuramate--L-alanine ligase [Candidatus Omnitrophota bacterium]|jgi:UDP-N-acetylmuramate--alanine ligase